MPHSVVILHNIRKPWELRCDSVFFYLWLSFVRLIDLSYFDLIDINMRNCVILEVTESEKELARKFMSHKFKTKIYC